MVQVLCELAIGTQVQVYRLLMTSTANTDLGLASAACTLPTAEQPLRLALFDNLISRHLQQVHRADPARLVLALTGGPEVAAKAADLAARETLCCSFFTFDLRISERTLTLAITTSAAHADVLVALADRAESVAGCAT